MGELTDKFGGKQPGELIQAADWNGLVAGVEALGEDLAARVGALEAQVGDRLGALEGRVATLEGGVQELQGTVGLLLQRARQVSLRTSRVRYTLGELAEVTARVTDARGNPLDLTAEADRPWVDFVSSWGLLRPVAGFVSLTGTGDRTLSVRVDARGEARVQLRSEHAEGFTQETETHVSTSLTTLVQGAKSVRDTILEANTPMEANLRGAFQVMSQEYDRTDAVNVRDYVDAYFVRQPTRVSGKLPSLSHDAWRDYRSTVLAVVKGDSDPSTPEPGQGVCSIQVTFRDWIGPWIHLDYLPKVKDLAADLGTLVQNNLGKDYAETTLRLKDKIAERVRNKGVIGRQRDYQAAFTALDNLAGATGRAAFVGDAARAVRGAITVQQTLDVSEITAFSPASQTGLDALTEIAVQSQAIAAVARQDVQKVREDLAREDGPIASLSKAVSTFSGRIEQIDRTVTGKADQKFVTGLFNLNPR